MTDDEALPASQCTLRRQHLMTRPSAGLRFQFGDFHRPSQHTEAQDINISPRSSTSMMEEAAAMLGGHWGIVFCQRHRPRRHINSSSSTKPDREVEPPFNVGGRAWHPHRRLASFQRSNSIVTRPSQANDEVRALSVNIVELGTCWHIIECLYFLSNGGDASDLWL
jgi:hypothetical protein